MLEKAVIPLDIHGRFEATLAMAAFCAGFGTRSITIVHVANGRGPEQAGRILAERRDRLAALGLETGLVRRSGHVAGAVVAAAREVQADLICIPWRPKGIFKRGLLGSITTDIIRMADIPVFVFKKDGFATDEQRLQGVLYATEFARTDARVLPYLTNPGLQAERLHLLHVGQRAPDPAAEKARLERVHAKLDRLAAACRPAFAQVSPLAVIGSPRRQITRQARRLKADLIVIGTFDSPDPLEQVLGSTAEGLPHTAHCSVLTIPGIRTTEDS